MQRNSTEHKLAVVRRKNQEKRKSLVIEEDFSSDSEESTTEPNKDLIVKDIKSIGDFKSSANHTDNDTQADISYDEHISKLKESIGDVRIKLRETRSLSKSKIETSKQYRSKFGDINFFSKSSTIFDARYFKESEFFGIYILFWLSIAFYMLKCLIHTYVDNSLPFDLNSPIVKTLQKDLIKIAITDLFMYLSMYVVYFIQWACLKKYISWNRLGSTIHYLYEFCHTIYWLKHAEACNFPWIGKVFLCLHGFVFLMKMHSYGSYNGYLWGISRELEYSKYLIAKLNEDDTSKSLLIPKDSNKDEVRKLLEESVKFCTFEMETQSMASMEYKEEFKEFWERIDMDDYNTKVNFPDNITIHNFFMYTMYPTVVYTLKYTRTKKIRWKYVFEKNCAIFGVIFLMILVAHNSLYPLVVRALEANKLPLNERYMIYFFILLDMIPPFLTEYLFTFFLIWDAILNAIAELSRFADRDFYGPWWSCTDWSEFARIWNRPVHNFLLRHVYHSSISTLKLNKAQASLMTFLISSVVHELVMYVIFGRLRGYLFLLQMSQLPLMILSRTRYMRDKKVLGNVICWFGFISGPSLICTLYLMF